MAKKWSKKRGRVTLPKPQPKTQCTNCQKTFPPDGDIDCPDCQGTGDAGNIGKDCQRCEGTGGLCLHCKETYWKKG